ncbi:TPA: fimbrial protein [Enterobacter roggenkampii]|nr:fimbrial protein [Enterobacter roggenkampii]
MNNISTHFEGTPNQGNADLLSLTGGPGYASGVAIGIYNPDKTLIPLGDESQLFTLSNNQLTATLDFYARYLADGGAVSPGTANAAATFILTYA